MRRVPAAASRLLAALLALSLTACLPTGGSRTPRPTITIGSTNFAEQVLLAELYGQALEARGYPVERRLSLGSREVVEPSLESGRIDLYVEYLATLLAFVSRGRSDGSPDPAMTHQRLREALQPRGLSVLNYAPAQNTNGFAVTRATAEKYHLATISDLAPVADRLVLGGPPECPVRPFCLPGLRQTYGIGYFRNFRVLDPGGPLTVQALASGQVDVALLFTTDPSIGLHQFVLLGDDRQLQLADNVAPVVRTEVLNRAPPDFATTLNDVSAKLTTAELTQLNGQVTIDARDPRAVAADWLKANGLGG